MRRKMTIDSPVAGLRVNSAADRSASVARAPPTQFIATTA